MGSNETTVRRVERFSLVEVADRSGNVLPPRSLGEAVLIEASRADIYSANLLGISVGEYLDIERVKE